MAETAPRVERDSWRFQIDRAASLYEISSPLEERVARDSRPTLRAMTDIYRGILTKIAADPRRVLSERVSLSVLSKLRIGWRADRTEWASESTARLGATSTRSLVSAIKQVQEWPNCGRRIRAEMTQMLLIKRLRKLAGFKNRPNRPRSDMTAAEVVFFRNLKRKWALRSSTL